MEEICNLCLEFKLSWLSKLYILLDRKDLFKIIKLIYGARVIVTSLYGSLQGQRQFMMCIEIAVWPFISVTIGGLGEILVTTDFVGCDKFGHFKSC